VKGVKRFFFASSINNDLKRKSVSDDVVDESPRSVEIDVSDGAVIMCMVWSRVEEVAPFVRDLAKKHNLVCYDPQEADFRFRFLSGRRRPCH
jgi:hypothetical protein